MNTTPTKYFVVSLPRTGTKSLCKMAGTVGLKFNHAPSVALPRSLHDNTIQFFADTPLYAPSYIEHMVRRDDYKFIYIDREVSEWKDSFERVGLHVNYDRLLTPSPSNSYMELDRMCLSEVFDSIPYDTETATQFFQTHKEIMYDMIPHHKLLTYEFTMGWEPFCEYLGVPVPQDILPHVNKNTMFEAL